MSGFIVTGASLTFVTSGTTFAITSISQGSISRESRRVSNFGTTGAHEYLAGALIDWDTFTVEFLLDPDVQPPIAAAAETVRITFPLLTGQITAAKVEGTGFVESWDFEMGEVDGIGEGSMVVRWDGFTGPAFTPST